MTISVIEYSSIAAIEPLKLHSGVYVVIELLLMDDQVPGVLPFEAPDVVSCQRNNPEGQRGELVEDGDDAAQPRQHQRHEGHFDQPCFGRLDSENTKIMPHVGVFLLFSAALYHHFLPL